MWEKLIQNWNMCFIIAGILWGIEMFPQLITTYRTKNVEGINIKFPIICLLSFLIFFIGCIGRKDWILLASNAVPFICISIWLGMILKYRRNK
jgi:uncharacterized protein with PQ loop repeat